MSTRATNFLLGIFLLSLLTLIACKKDSPKSKLAGLTEFSIQNIPAAFTIDEVQRVIQNADSLPYQTDVSALVAVFTSVPNAMVKIGGTMQTSGVTVNNFNSPLMYDVVAEDGVTTRSYTVRVNVALVDPKTVSWELLTANAGWGTYKSVPAGFFNNKFRLYGSTLNGNGTMNSSLSTSTDGITWAAETAQAPNTLAIPPGEFSTLVTNFKNKMYLLGGYELQGTTPTGYFFDKVVNNTWSSSDGLNWTKSEGTTDATLRWAAREHINAVVFKDKLWVVGGTRNRSFGNTGSALNDIWSSADGETWTSELAVLPFTPKQLPALFVHEDKMWLAGGKNGATYFNEVWNSTDGKVWNQVTTTTSFTARWAHKVVSYNGSLYLVGGEDPTGYLSDMWVSEDDGVNWTKVEAGDVRALPANFNNRRFFNMFVHNSYMYIIGGQGKEPAGNIVYRNDVWRGKLVK